MEYRFSKNANININNHNIKNVGMYTSDINLRSLSEKKSKPNPRHNDIITNADGNDIVKLTVADSVNVLPSPEMDLEVEIVDASNFQKAARTLLIAFANDDFTKYLTKDIESPQLREKVDLALFEASVFSSILDGVVVAIRDKELELINSDAPYLAVACFTRPDMDSGFWDRVYNGNFRRELILNDACSQKVFHEQFPILDETKSNILQEEELKLWYLGDLGTTPNARGKGCAKKLLSFVYEQFIDKEEGAICYLESSHPRNRVIYEKLGYTFVEKLKVGHVDCKCIGKCDDKPLEMDIMVRGVKGAKWIRKSFKDQQDEEAKM